ncbi:MAG TPA: ABC transporter permease [Candidatus Diapherotrites archaeon]|nr:ABC transporter permease [Candidatus Diapherotrites archaeon]
MNTIYTIWLRDIKHFLRSKSRIIGSIGMPLFFILILGFGFNSIIQLPGMEEDYTQFLIPGMIAMSVLFTSMFAGIQIIWDKQFGFLKETLVAPVTRFGIMLGQTLGGATTAFIQGTIILILALIFGILHVSSFGSFLIAFGFMLLIGIFFTATGVAIASRMDDMHGFQLIMNFVIFPIVGLSGAFFPITVLPSWIKPITYINPLSYGVEGIRYGLTGASLINPLICFIVLGSFAIFMVLLGGHLFKNIKV